MKAAFNTTPLVTLLVAGAGLSSCDSGPADVDPRFQMLAGTYRAVEYIEFSYFSSCSYFDALERGGFFRMNLEEDGSVSDGRYYLGIDGPRDRGCAPFGSAEVAFSGFYRLSGDTLMLDLTQSCHEKWHESLWLSEAGELRYLGFDAGHGPCMPDVTLQRE